jgi:hypothetical protein
MKKYLKYSNLAIFSTSIILLFCFFSCNTPKDNIPYEPVDITINLNNVEYADIKSIGGHVMIYGGYKGIVIYKVNRDEYTAFERACPYDPFYCRVDYDSIEENLLDTCCGSRFSLIFEGSIINGPAELPLRQYQTYYNSNLSMLRITN